MTLGDRRGANAAIWRTGAALLLILAAAMAVVLSPRAVVAQDDETEPDATVRFVHASPGAPNVDILVDGQAVVQDIAFGSATEYLAVTDGDHTVQVVPAGQSGDAAVIDTDLNVDSGDAYIFVVMNRLNEIEGKLFDVDLDPIDEGKARVRAIHASPDAGEVNIAVSGGDELFGDLEFEDSSDYTDVDAGVYSLDVKGDGDRVLVTAQNLELTAGDVYDIVAIGQISDNTIALLPLVTSVSVPCTDVLGLEGGAEDACLRVVHAVPGGPNVDVYLNDSPVVQGLAFGTATEYLALPAGDDRRVQIVAEGGTPGDTDILDSELDLDGRFAYEIVATGNPDDVEATVAQLDLSPLPDGQARIRVIHASTDAAEVDVAVADGPTLFEDVDFRDVTSYETVDAGSYNLQLMKDDAVALAGEVVLEAGTVYDVIAVGRVDDNSLALVILTATALVREGDVATPESQGTAEVGTAEATVVASEEPGEGTVVPTAGAIDPTATP